MPNVSRSVVPAETAYGHYREFLRFDFWYSCAYCSLSEIEATGVGFEIDHFEPQKVSPDKIDKYDNLVWSCAVCNRSKSAIWPTDAHQAMGFRYIRPDVDDLDEHYELSGLRLDPKSKAGEWTINMLILNKAFYRTIRELRHRLKVSSAEIVGGMQALESVRIDNLRQEQRHAFVSASQKVLDQFKKLGARDEKDLIVRVLNHSPLLDMDENRVAQVKARKAYLHSLNALVPLQGTVD
jgi:hypothetical protein